MMAGRRRFPTRKELFQYTNSWSQKRINPITLETKKGSDAFSQNNNSNDNINEEVAKKVLEDAEFQCLMYEVKYPEQFELDHKAKSFIECLLSRNPRDRPRFDGIKKHPWLQGETFDEKEILKTAQIPDWVKDHTYLQSIDSSMLDIATDAKATSTTNFSEMARVRKDCFSDHRYYAKNRRKSLLDCIDDLCSDRFERCSSSYMEKFVTKWTSSPHPATIDLFRHWNYMSDDAIQSEMRQMEKCT